MPEPIEWTATRERLQQLKGDLVMSELADHCDLRETEDDGIRLIAANRSHEASIEMLASTEVFVLTRNTHYKWFATAYDAPSKGEILEDMIDVMKEFLACEYEETLYLRAGRSIYGKMLIKRPEVNVLLTASLVRFGSVCRLFGASEQPGRASKAR